MNAIRSLGGNYFHALSHSDLCRGWTTITLRSLTFLLFPFFYFLFLHKIKKEQNTSTRECNLSLCCLTILAKPELAKKAFSFSYSSRVHRLDTRSKHHDGWSPYTQGEPDKSWYLHWSTVILHVEHSRQRNQAPVCSLTSTTEDSDKVHVKWPRN